MNYSLNRSSQALRTLDSAETLNTDNTIIQHLDASTCKRHLVVRKDKTKTIKHSFVQFKISVKATTVSQLD